MSADDPKYLAWREAKLRYRSPLDLREPDEESLYGEWLYEQEEERAARLARYRRSLPPRAAEFGELPCALADSFYEDTRATGGILVLSGPTGVGKTVAACRWAYRVTMDRGYAVTFVTAAAFAAQSRYSDERRALLSHRHLILDDLGAEYLDAKGSLLADIDELVDTHYRHRTHLAITTNATKNVFEARYGARVMDRLRECGRWISMAGASRRRSP